MTAATTDELELDNDGNPIGERELLELSIRLELRLPFGADAAYITELVASIVEHSSARDAIIAGLDGADCADVELESLRLIVDDPPARLGHCTTLFRGHSPACDRDGTYCSSESTHDGPCTPHGKTTAQGPKMPAVAVAARPRRIIAGACVVGPVGGHSNRRWCATHRAYVEHAGQYVGDFHVWPDEDARRVARDLSVDLLTA